MAHDVFISYSSKDKPSADAACAKLEERGIRCWMAPRDILPGADWSSSIIDGINEAAAMVLVFSAHANASQQIKREVERAVNKGIPVIPLRIENVAPEKSLEYFISTPHWLDAFSPPLDRHLAYLGDVISHILDGKPVTERPAPLPPPWWRGPIGYATGGGVLLVLAILVWFTVLRPPPGFAGTWMATSLDIHQFTAENAMTAAELPAQMLAATVQGPDAKATLQIDPSGQFSLAISGTDHGSVTASPAGYTLSGTSLTFTSDITHTPLTTNLILFKLNPSGSGSFDPGTDTLPDGHATFQMMLMPAGQSSGTPLGDFTGTPNAGGSMQVLDLISGTWQPQQFSYMQSGSGSNVKVVFTITADGHYNMTFSLQEHGLWTAADGHWSRQIPSANYGPPSSDGGTYTFTGRNVVNLYDDFGVSTWKRTS
jgi:hypothetical protein